MKSLEAPRPRLAPVVESKDEPTADGGHHAKLDKDGGEDAMADVSSGPLTFTRKTLENNEKWAWPPPATCHAV